MRGSQGTWNEMGHGRADVIERSQSVGMGEPLKTPSGWGTTGSVSQDGRP